MAIGASRLDNAQEHLDTLMQQGQNVMTLDDLQAQIYFRSGQLAAGINSSELAIAANTTEATTYLYLGKVISEQHERDYSSPFEALPSRYAREVADLYNKAIEYAPGLLEAYERLAWTLASTRKVTDLDLFQLENSLELFPENGALHLGIAVFYYHRNDIDRALEYLQFAEALEYTLSENDKQTLEVFLKAWLMEQYLGRIDEYVSTQDFESAITLAEELLNNESISGLSKRPFQRHIYPEIILRQNLWLGEQAYKNDENDEGHLYLQAVIDDENATAQMRSYAQRMIDRNE